jgi:spore germination cell wall hydrolase CwlJ-like protein
VEFFSEKMKLYKTTTFNEVEQGDEIMKKYIPGVVKFATIIFGMWLTTAVLVGVTKSKFQALEAEKVEMTNINLVTADDRDRQLRCLTQNIYFEAASEPFEGKVAVAQVTMNRVANSQFPGDVCGVVYQKNIFYSKVVCQFSWACDGNHKVKPIYAPLYKESEEVAKKVLLENFRLPSLKNALYYHADYVRPGWGKTPVAKIGHHIFY